MRVRDFKKDILFFRDKLKSREKFSFSKYADGELSILKENAIDLTRKANGEFKFDPRDASDKKYQENLMSSFKHCSENYYVGIGCPCCIGTEDFNWMHTNSGQEEENLTWANLWVNSNYATFKSDILPLFSDYDVYLVCNKSASLEHLPFSENIRRDWRIGTNAWKDDYELVGEIQDYTRENGIKGALFLFAAGPFGNILAHQLWDSCPDNTYLDIGSTLDPFLFGQRGYTRGYHGGAPTIRKVCQWGDVKGGACES